MVWSFGRKVVIAKNKRLQLQKSDKVLRSRRDPTASSTVQSHPFTENLAELERKHAAWLKRRGHAYISLEEAARLWNRSPQQIIRWEELADEQGF